MVAPEYVRTTLLPLVFWHAPHEWYRAKRSRLLVYSQDRLGRDGLDADTASGESMSTLSEGPLEMQEAPHRKHRKQLTSTEYALQEIR